jgi:hypothetical protein
VFYISPTDRHDDSRKKGQSAAPAIDAFVPRRRTVQVCQDLLAGRYDTTAEDTFTNTGGLEDTP